MPEVSETKMKGRTMSDDDVAPFLRCFDSRIDSRIDSKTSENIGKTQEKPGKLNQSNGGSQKAKSLET